jgi:hypothetical protein
MDLIMKLTPEHFRAVLHESTMADIGGSRHADDQYVNKTLAKVKREIVDMIQHFHQPTMHTFYESVFPVSAESVDTLEEVRATFKAYSGLVVGVQSGTVASRLSPVSLRANCSCDELHGMTLLMMNGDRIKIVTE